MALRYDKHNLREMLDKRQVIFSAIRGYRLQMRSVGRARYLELQQLLRDAQARTQMLTRDIKLLYERGDTYKLPGPKRWGRDRRLADPIGFLSSKSRAAWPSDIV